ncbi:MAG TPA: hypothetical protein VGF59_35220, partial [Bryobacteraceae bacterium]
RGAAASCGAWRIHADVSGVVARGGAHDASAPGAVGDSKYTGRSAACTRRAGTATGSRIAAGGIYADVPAGCTTGGDAEYSVRPTYACRDSEFTGCTAADSGASN